MYILFIDDWLLCIVIASVVQWSALCLTHWIPWLNLCGKHNIFNFKSNAIMSIALSYITSDTIKLNNLSGKWRELWANPLETGVQVRLMTSVVRLLSLFHANYKVNYNLCDDCFRCLVGALLTLEVNTLNSSGSNPRKNVDGGTTVLFYWSSWKETYLKKKEKLSLSNKI